MGLFDEAREYTAGFQVLCCEDPVCKDQGRVPDYEKYFLSRIMSVTHNPLIVKMFVNPPKNP